MKTQIYHKKNEIFEEEFFKDEECTEVFDFTNAKDLYIKLKNGDCTPIFALSNKLSALNVKARIFTPIWYLGWRDGISPQTPLVTLDDVLCGDESGKVNLSKYIPKDNAVLFLDEECYDKYRNHFQQRPCELLSEYILPNIRYTIFIHRGTQSELQKANEVGKYLWENFGIKPNLCALHWFGSEYQENDFKIKYLCKDFGVLSNFNKIITTNSTGILKPEDSNERLQVIDGKEIFEEYLKTEIQLI